MPPKIRKGSTTAKGSKESENICSDCRTPVHNNDKAIACDLCEHWMQAQCQDMPDTTYAFLSDSEDSGINWYCNHCKVIATRVVSEVSEMAKNYQDMDKRVKKLETQIKSKANEADLEELWRELHSDMEAKVTQDTLTNLEQTSGKKQRRKWRKLWKSCLTTFPDPRTSCVWSKRKWKSTETRRARQQGMAESQRIRTKASWKKK